MDVVSGCGRSIPVVSFVPKSEVTSGARSDLVAPFPFLGRSGAQPLRILQHGEQYRIDWDVGVGQLMHLPLPSMLTPKLISVVSPFSSSLSAQ